MLEMGLSGLMSGDGKRGGAQPSATASILDSTGANRNVPRALLLLRDQPWPEEDPPLQYHGTSHERVDRAAVREAFPEDAAPCCLILDHDRKYAGQASEMLKHLGSQLIRTGFRSPWQNGIAERWVGNCRRALLDHVIVLNEHHLRRLIRDYIRYYHEDRIHDSLDKDTPERRAIEPRGVTGSEVVGIPRLGGLHHRYTRHKAA